jgi:elongator complex protein 3
MQASDYDRACSEISGQLLAINCPTKKQVRSAIMRVCSKYSLTKIPGNHEILATARGSDFDRLQGVLMTSR